MVTATEILLHNLNLQRLSLVFHKEFFWQSLYEDMTITHNVQARFVINSTHMKLSLSTQHCHQVTPILLVHPWHIAVSIHV